MFFRKSKQDQPAAAQPPEEPTRADVERKAVADLVAPVTPAVAQPTSAQDQDPAKVRGPADLAAIRQAVSFAQIVGVMLRSERHARLTIADLEWLVIPAIVTRQFSIAEASSKANGRRFPVAVALWASVSPDVDKRLSQDAATPLRLSPNEWRSGDILWLIDAVGDPRAVPVLLNGLKEKAWGGRAAKNADSGR